MCASTVAVADALPAQPATVIGDSTVERSGISTSMPLVAVHPVGAGDGVAVGVGLGDGVAVGLGVGVGLGSTVKDRVSAVELLSARSIARIVNVYAPAAIPVYVFGDVQLVYVLVTVPGPSSMHSNLPSSFETNSNDAVVAVVTAGGPLRIVAPGGLWSTVQFPENQYPVSFPAASVTKTKAYHMATP
jgi:hypothetical protein